MNDTIQVFILNQKDYREKDVLLQVLSEQYGRLSIVAAGARKMTSHNAGRILPYTEADFTIDYVPGRTIFRLKGARTISLYRHTREDLVLSAAAAVLCDTMKEMCEEGTGHPEALYELLKKGMDSLESGHDANTVLALYMADLLRMFGSCPDVDECTVCGKKFVRSISVKDGGFLCEEHAAASHVPFLPAEDLKRFRLLCKATLDRLDLVEGISKASSSDVHYLADFLNAYTGSSIASIAFYEEVSAF